MKFDGYRMLCRIDRGRVTVWSRNGKDWTEKFQNVVEALKSLKAKSAMLDGEIVIVDAQGRSSFQKLQRAMGTATTTGFAYEVFDLIYIGQVYSIFSLGAETVTGSKAIPHFGQEPDLDWRTSGCMGQVYSRPSVAGNACGFVD